MKKILIPVSIVAILLCASWKEDAKTVFAGSFVSGGQWKVLVCNEQGRQ